MKPSKHYRARYWQSYVLAEASLLRAEVESAGGDCAQETLDRIEKLLKEAENAASYSPRNPFVRLLSRVFGYAVSYSYVNLHAAAVLWARHAPDHVVDLRLERVKAKLLTISETNNPRTRVLQELLDESPKTLDEKRETLSATLEWIYSALDSEHERVRDFRNIVWVCTGVLLAAAVALSVFGALQPNTIQLCFKGETVCPTGDSPTGGDTLAVVLLGALGGAVSAIVAIRKMEGTANPYSVPLALAVLKMPMGAVTAFIGLLLIHGQFLPGLTDLDTEGQILAYAIVFGAAQQLVTQVVDRQGRDVLARVADKRVKLSTEEQRVSMDARYRRPASRRPGTTRRGQGRR